MNIIKGFGTITEYVTNVPNQVAILGELSSWSRTYAKDKGEYQHSDVLGYELTTFRSVNSATNAEIVVSQDQVRQILSLIRECVSYATSHVRPYDPIDFKNWILNAFFQRVGDLEFGDFIDNGTLALPEWISWTNIEVGADQGNKIKIWLADQSFQNQYDEYEIEVVPPLEPLDNFFFAYGNVVQQLQSVTLPMFMEKVQVKKGVYPETYVRVLTFDFYNSMNPQQKYPTNWAVLIYGQQGDNIDSIKDAIVEYVLANSTHAKAEWEVILPDLFKRTEFNLFPRWDKIAVPNQSWISSLYKSMQDPRECLEFAKNAIDYYTDAWIENNTTVFPYDYKTLMLVAVNGDTNVASAARLDQIFPDYLPVPSTSQDFNRMTPKTREWVLFLQDLLLASEVATAYSAVPPNLRRQWRSGILFISGMYDNVNYLVAARSNTQIYPQPT